ncbi:hypothetical protein SynBIOSE41_00098 [Synechococcus sp. BIOS-E4-1]|nr:hypothetical protein SynBIOSE41_00098 [Synechococcus sp. BIOS-E4-1]
MKRHHNSNPDGRINPQMPRKASCCSSLTSFANANQPIFQSTIEAEHIPPLK